MMLYGCSSYDQWTTTTTDGFDNVDNDDGELVFVLLLVMVMVMVVVVIFILLLLPSIRCCNGAA